LKIHYEGGETKPVASYDPNLLGLYDMSGNVWEWTCSEYRENYDGSELECSVSAVEYSLRGGSWNGLRRGVRAAYRGNLLPGIYNHSIGFRLVRDN
jgi:formylglycine-generating enzyme required for sulfatase activity